MSWKKVRLGDLITESRILANNPDPNRRIRVKLNIQGVEKRPVESEIEGATRQFIRRKGQFIYGKQNFHKGAFGIIPDQLDGFETSADIPSFDVRSDCLVEWIFYYFKIGNRFLELEKIARGVGSKRIHPEQIAEILIPLPKIEEQRRIISRFKSLESNGTEISLELTHQLSLVKQLRQAFLREAMQGKLVAQHPEDGHAKDLLAQIKEEKAKIGKKDKPLPPITPEEIPFEIPEGWVWCRLGEVVLHSEAGKSYKCEEIPISNENEWGVIKVSAVSWDIFLEDQNKLFSKTVPSDISAKVNQGDFLISRANTSELVGKSVVVNTISKNLLLSDKTIRFKFPSFINSDFINLCNNSGYARNYYATKGTGSSPSMKNITREQMRELLIPLPPYHEQKRIMVKVSELKEYFDKLEQSVKRGKIETEQLLQQVLTEALSN